MCFRYILNRQISQASMDVPLAAPDDSTSNKQENQRKLSQISYSSAVTNMSVKSSSETETQPPKPKHKHKLQRAISQMSMTPDHGVMSSGVSLQRGVSLKSQISRQDSSAVTNMSLKSSSATETQPSKPKHKHKLQRAISQMSMTSDHGVMSSGVSLQRGVSLKSQISRQDSSAVTNMSVKSSSATETQPPKPKHKHELQRAISQISMTSDHGVMSSGVSLQRGVSLKSQISRQDSVFDDMSSPAAVVEVRRVSVVHILDFFIILFGTIFLTREVFIRSFNMFYLPFKTKKK